MSENVRKLIGVAIMAVLVVVGVVTTSGGDDDVDFTRNLGAFGSEIGEIAKLPEAQQARLAPAFLQQAAPKSLDTGPINIINKEVGPIFKGAKTGIVSGTGAHALWTGKASVLKGKGVDGKGGTSSFSRKHFEFIARGGTSIFVPDGRNDGKVTITGGKADVWRQEGNATVVADRIEKCGYVTSAGNDEIATANSLKNVLVSIYVEDKSNVSKNPASSVEFDSTGYNCQDLQGNNLLPDDASFLAVINPDSMKPLLLAECMESKVGDVFLKSHIKASAAKCVAIVLPALSPKRAIQLGTYWQTQQQLVGTD